MKNILNFLKNKLFLTTIVFGMFVISSVTVYALNVWNTGYRMDSNNTTIEVLVGSNEECYEVNSTNILDSFFIPTKTTTEWNAFVNNLPSGVTVNECCTDTTWSPSPSTICGGSSFTQTSNCGATRSTTGTQACACSFNAYGVTSFYEVFGCGSIDSYNPLGHCIVEGQSFERVFCEDGLSKIECSNEGTLNSSGECVANNQNIYWNDILYPEREVNLDCEFYTYGQYDNYTDCSYTNPVDHCNGLGQEIVTAFCLGDYKYIQCSNAGALDSTLSSCERTAYTGYVTLVPNQIVYFPEGDLDPRNNSCDAVYYAKDDSVYTTSNCPTTNLGWCTGTGQSFGAVWCSGGTLYIQCIEEGSLDVSDKCCGDISGYCTNDIILGDFYTPPCVDTTWSPDPSTVCAGTYFTQTSNCGTTRTAVGTKYCCTISSWSPDPSTVCAGTYFTQTSNCGTTRTSVGTKYCCVPNVGSSCYIGQSCSYPYVWSQWCPYYGGTCVGYPVNYSACYCQICTPIYGITQCNGSCR